MMAPSNSQAASANFKPAGNEYAIAGNPVGDQAYPQLMVRNNGGIVVWQDNATDASGLGISAQVLDSNFSPVLSPFRVNEKEAGDQEKPQVAALPGGGAVFVWQGGAQGAQDIYARFLDANNTFKGGDLLVNAYTQEDQAQPAVAVCPDGNVWVAWSSFNQDGDMMGIFARRLNASGQMVGEEFQVNQFAYFNQRNATIAALPNNTVVIAWVSEQQRKPQTVDIYARVFKSTGESMGGEFLINTENVICSNPAITALAQGGYAIAWSQKNLTNSTNSWDIYGRIFNAQSYAAQPAFVINQTTYGDQFAPKISAVNDSLMVVWTALLQDGSFEGVFGRFLSSSGAVLGDEFQVNTTTTSKQQQQTVLGDGNGRFLVCWSSYVVGQFQFDLYAQRYAVEQLLQKPSNPFVSALNSSSLSVAWPPVAGYQVVQYELAIDNNEPIVVQDNQFTLNGLDPESRHSFSIAYQLSDGRKSPNSDTVWGKTWGLEREDGLPSDWLSGLWGSDSALWPSASADSDHDGADNYSEFLAGTNPKDYFSVLRTRLEGSSLGWRLVWNTQLGFVYQVQFSSDMKTWENLGTPRFSADVQDSAIVDGNRKAAYYRIIRMR
jgi:hypothetical protein